MKSNEERQDKLARTESQQPGKLSTLSDRTVAISKAMIDVNMLTGYPLPAEEIVHWSKELDRLWPDLTRQELTFVLDSFKTGDIAWDRSMGIQNLFKALKRVEKTEFGFKIRREGVW